MLLKDRANIMVENFLSYIVGELSVEKTNKVLLAVSGGVDSMVMMDLFIKSGYTVEVAHINHSTRNGQSDEDAVFVKNYCIRHKIPFHLKTLDYDMLSVGNFQQNARNHRYAFLHEVMKVSKLDYLATAHHMDDRWETFLMNLNRKSGINGLTSLRPKSRNIIRPLIAFRKVDIEHYADQNGIPFVIDSSNEEDDYTRNSIRHNISPQIEKVFPGFISNANESIQHLQSTDALLQELIEQSGLLVSDQGKELEILDLTTLKKFNNKESLAFQILHPYGFNNSDVEDILSTNTTGAIFHTSDYEALYDRDRLIIRPKSEVIKTYQEIDKTGTYKLLKKIEIAYKLSEKAGQSKHIVSFNGNTYETSSPVIVRSIEPGDKFYPDHMNGKSKSVKKHLNDLKVDRFSREQVLVVLIDDIIKAVLI